MSKLLAFRLRISRGESQKRIDTAAELGPRRALSGQPLEPVLEHTAAAERRGVIGTEHIAIIREFFAKLPGAIDVATRARADRSWRALPASTVPKVFARPPTGCWPICIRTVNSATGSGLAVAGSLSVARTPTV